MKTAFIVNPTAGEGRLKKQWPGLLDAIRKRIPRLDYSFTKGEKHATGITRQYLKKGFDLIVSVGGDGTLSECVNGFFENGKKINPEGMLGTLPFGRGCDLARNLSISKDPLLALDHLTGRHYRSLDVGRASFRALSGHQETRYFLNIANVGLVSMAVDLSQQVPRILGSRISYLYGTLRGILTYQPKTVIYRILPEGDCEVKLLNPIIANGKYFGSGMKAAPKAEMSDGFFDCLVAPKMNLFDFLRYLPRLYTGDHQQGSKIDYFRTKLVEVFSKNKGDFVSVEMDGDTVGRLPATFEVLPKAIRFKVL